MDLPHDHTIKRCAFCGLCNLFWGNIDEKNAANRGIFFISGYFKLFCQFFSGKGVMQNYHGRCGITRKVIKPQAAYTLRHSRTRCQRNMQAQT